jgi:Mg2+ and Co2+ transporter CorA
MDVRHIAPEGVQRYRPDEIDALLEAPGLVWVDVKYWDAETASTLAPRLGLHPRAVHDCAVGSPAPKVHVYRDQIFLVLHTLDRDSHGRVHHVELDQFVGPNWLLTVHGRMDTEVSLDAAYVETGSLARKLDSGRLRPERAGELSAAVVGVMINRLREFLTDLTHESWRLERQVTAGHAGDPEQFLEELFGVRHGLLAVRTVASLSREVYGRMATLSVFGPSGSAQLVDLEDQLRRLTAMADSQREYLQGVIEFYQTRIGTKMTIAAERLAVIAAVTLPITALSSILGMNVIVHSETDVGQLVVLLTVMATMSVMMLIWAHRKGWW